MAIDLGQTHKGDGIVLGHLLRGNGGSIRSGGWEDLVRDPMVDHRSVEHSLSILANREYEENGPSQA